MLPYVENQQLVVTVTMYGYSNVTTSLLPYMVTLPYPLLYTGLSVYVQYIHTVLRHIEVYGKEILYIYSKLTQSFGTRSPLVFRPVPTASIVVLNSSKFEPLTT